MSFTRTGIVISELRDLRAEMRDLRAETKDLRAETKLELARNREEAERGREALRRVEKEFELNRVVYGRLESFTDELLRRSEETHREMIREMRDLRDASRAQRDGFLALIDRLFPPQPPQPSQG